ncbi:MAG: SpoIIE family protein phosphatase [Armatimonadetes bacterium]|nr:SpoIIE family protein phosphatase [Armatimonadota bacterium]
MATRYLHVEIATSQASKQPNEPCGDLVRWVRTPAATTMVCADGIGSGIKANVAAQICVARLMGLLEEGFSLRRAFASLVTSIEKTKTDPSLYVAFSLARILNDGETTVLSYEAPGAVLVARTSAVELPRRTVVVEGAITEEASCHLEPGEGILLMSDGVSQAGLGGRVPGGWQVEGACRYVTGLLGEGIRPADIPQAVTGRAVQLSAGTAGDDTTALYAWCRAGKTVTILTGPPAEKRRDHEVAHRFMAMDGAKVICGATTADLVARYLGTEVRMDHASHSLVTPPAYMLDGVDLVTEGAVTLNQLYNVLDEDDASFEEPSAVTELHNLLRSADRVNILVGQARNPANTHITFRQQGILPRHKIIELLAEKLQAAGKLVVIERV